MLFNVAFIDHLIRMVGGPLRLYWMVFVRKDFCLHGQWLQVLLSLVYHQINGGLRNKTTFSYDFILFCLFCASHMFSFFFNFWYRLQFYTFHCTNKNKEKSLHFDLSLSSQFIQFFSVVRFFTSIIVNFAMLIKLLGRLPNPIAQMQNPLTNNKFPNCQSLCQLILNQDLIALKVRPNVPF